MWTETRSDIIMCYSWRLLSYRDLYFLDLLCYIDGDAWQSMIRKDVWFSGVNKAQHGIGLIPRELMFFDV